VGPICNPFLGWMKASPSQHLWSIRISGAFAMLGFIALLVALLRNAK
jgi:hypothetical protein